MALLALPPAVGAADEPSGCEQVTPPDAPFACLEVFPLGDSASVTLDGTTMGLSPIGIPEIAPGEHTLRIDRTGSYPWYATITLAPGESRRIDPPLAPLVGIYELPGIGDLYPLAVMVENHPDARPQVGLDKADVVYEALAEGGISRFQAIYITQEADVIGPVRSTRHYFVYTAAEYNATLAYVGASPIGYAALSAVGIRGINESYGDPGIWRSSYRDPPHNAYTGTVEARAASDSLDPGGPGSWGPIIFKDPSFPADAPRATHISVQYPPLGWYGVEYNWDPATNFYPRIMDRSPHLDGITGEQYQARNVIIQVVPDEVIDQEGRLDLAQVGEGKAYYFMDGTVTEGIWTKADFGSRTFYWDTAGNLVRLSAIGTTWIQLVPPQAVIQYS